MAIGDYERALSMNRYKKRSIIIVIAIGVIFLIIYRAFFDIQHIDGQEKIAETVSPDDRYTVTAYVNDGGATSGYAVLCTAVNNKTGRARNIYWQYRCEEAKMQWTDDWIVVINGIELDVKKDSYDWRDD